MKRRLIALLGTVALAVPLLLVHAATSASADSSAVVTDKSVAVPTSWQWLTGASPTTIGNQINAGWRLVDLEVDQESPILFTARFVPNSGSYAAAGGWWWYYGQTISQVNTLTSNNGARLIDAEGYDTSSGARYAVIMVKNSGATARSWLWRVNSSPTTINNELRANNSQWRPITAESFVTGGTKYYLVVAVGNTSVADRKTWGWGWGWTAS